MVGEQREVASLDHAGGKMAHDRLGLDMQVPQHFIRAPSAKKADAIGVDIRAEECHGARCTEGPGRDVVRQEAMARAKDGGGEAQRPGEVGRNDAAEMLCSGRLVRGQRLGGRSVALA